MENEALIETAEELTQEQPAEELPVEKLPEETPVEIPQQSEPAPPVPKVCPKCEADLRIVGSVYKSERSDDPDQPDRIYLVQQLRCMNPACGSNETFEKRHLLN